MQNKKFSIIGAGNWGLALATVLADNDVDVLLWTRDEEEVQNININHRTSYFKNIHLDTKISASTNLEEVFAYANDILIAIPVTVLDIVLKEMVQKFSFKNYLIASKGLLNGKTVSDILEEYNNTVKTAALSGPSFAIEVVNKDKTAVNIASKDIDLAKRYQNIFSNANFRVYATTDIIGVEYCGAIKNVYAIAAGLIDAHGYGYNTKSAFLTRAIAELENLILYVGGEKATLFGLSGIGDLMLTCYSNLSRNYTFGYNFKGSLKTDKTVEGINALKEMYHISQNKNFEMPIVKSLYKVIYENKNLEHEINELMLRKVKVLD